MFFILSTFFIFLKTFIDSSIKKFEKHFWRHRNELIRLDFITVVDGWMQTAQQLCVDYVRPTEHNLLR